MSLIVPCMTFTPILSVLGPVVPQLLLCVSCDWCRSDYLQWLKMSGCIIVLIVSSFASPACLLCVVVDLAAAGVGGRCQWLL